MTVRHILILLKCGCVTGILWAMCQMLVMVVANELGALSVSDRQQLSSESYFLADVLSGQLAIFLYVFLRRRMMARALAGLATVLIWELLHVLQVSALTVSIYYAVVAVSASITGIGLSLAIGAWLYEITDNPHVRE